MTSTYERNVVLSSKTFDVVGTRPVRHDGHEKVTGAAKYGADLYPTGVLFGKVLRSPHAHAKIKSIDTSAAEKHPGVLAVVTAKDFPIKGGDQVIKVGEGTANIKYLQDAVMATDKALFKGHPIAGVAAVNVHVAEEALALIKVDYEVLPSVLTAVDAMKPGAPIIHPQLRTDALGDTKKDNPTNIDGHVLHKMGDADAGFKRADVVVEREFNTATVHQGYIEPHNTTVNWGRDGRVYVWQSTQGPFDIRDATAKILGLSDSMVKLTPLEIGGGFGGKFSPYGTPVAALLSKKTGRPVKIIMTRQEDLEATGPTPGSYIKVKIGATKEGKITAATAYMAYESGAYPESFVGLGAMAIFAPYDIANVTIEGFGAICNKPSTAAYRAPGATNAEFASETVIDEIARKLKVDPIDFRLLNAAKEGTRRADGPVYPKIGCVEVLEAMKNHPHYKAPLKGKNIGRGVAVGWWINAGLQSACTITVNPDGTCGLVEGSPDIGGSRTAISMQAAEALGIPVEDIRPQVVSTDEVGFTAGTGGSRVTFATGWAAYEAAQDVKRQMITRAATIWDVPAESLKMEKGVVMSKMDSELKMTFKHLAGELNGTGGPIVGRGTVDPKGVGPAFAGDIVDVEVDPETGKTTIKRFTVVQDVGKAIHPSYVEGQLQGGSVQGIGWALNEEYFMTPEGRMANSTLLDYRMPTALDLPLIDTVLVEVANPGHPFGVRGVGEVNIVPPPAAIANAISQAVGVRMEVLPMKPGAVMEAIWKSGKNGNGAKLASAAKAATATNGKKTTKK
ncbi:MAG: xanthine dehydrogenase family protein molybdopterin-binding subunit [SAR202 cluster bacterium]|nr:xanthine dehydrogenase family protein molybdopterin-binding subunit [SAR202 cluster bacterium]